MVHASAGAAVVALLLVIGRRRRWPDAVTRPHSIPLVVLGAGLLWFGWFGFNGADGLRANGVAAIIIGGLAGLICHLALRLKQFLRLDDALDAIAVHFAGGVLGTFLLGFFGDKSINSIGANGLLYGGGSHLLGEQVLGIVVVVAFSFCLTWVIAAAVAKTIGLRVLPADENDLDQVQEAMSAYAHLGAVAHVVVNSGEGGSAPDMGAPAMTPEAVTRDHSHALREESWMPP